MSTFDTLNGIFRIVLNDGDIRITQEMITNGIEDWDSLRSFTEYSRRKSIH